MTPDGDPESQQQGHLTATFVELAAAMVARDFDIADFLHLLCERTHGVLPVDAVGVVLEGEDGRLALSAASTDEAATIDLFEMQEREGPCFDAYTTGRQIVELELEQLRPRWPGFVDRALAEGFLGVYGIPLRLDDDHIGAMNLFQRSRDPLRPDEIGVAQALADVATISLINQRSLRRAEERAGQLQHALDSRVIIEQAKGVLAERRGIDVTAAFWRLRRHSKRNQLALREVCRQVIEEGLRPPE